MFLLVNLFCVCISAFAQSVVVDVSLSPAGSFKAETKSVKGFAKKTADGVLAENILVDLNSLKTGMSLRDKHMKERLDAKGHPTAKLIKAIGKNGKGKGLLEIKGKKVEVNGDYTIDGKILKSTFKMKLSDLAIKDVSYMNVGVEDEVTLNVQVPLK